MNKFLVLGFGFSLSLISYAISAQTLGVEVPLDEAQNAKCVSLTSPISPPLRPEFEANSVEAPSVDEIEAPLKNLTAAQKLRAYRARLEEKNLILLEKKMELIRLEQEMALIRSLEKAMDKTISAIEKL